MALPHSRLLIFWHCRVVLIDQTITYLEMTSADQLLAGRVPPAEVTLDSVDATALGLIRSIHDRIAAPHHWSSLEWSEQQWSDLLSRPGVRSWIARAEGDIIGLVQMEIHPQRDVEITKFGLVPEFVGRGFGGHLLALATQLAWDVDGVVRVWLHTSSFDHPHALGNYRNRGFRQFRVEQRPRDIGAGTGCGRQPDTGAVTLPPIPRRVPGSRQL